MSAEENWSTDRLESILRKEVIWKPLIIMAVLYMAMFFLHIPMPTWEIAGKGVFQGIYSMDFGAFYDTQINLIVTAISMIAIVTSFFNQRYLGKSYKYWCFRRTPYVFTPQEIIFLMVINQFSGMLHLITGKYRAIALISVLICWGFFVYLLNQIYVYIVKISRLFCKIRKKIEKDDDFCERIRKALRVVSYQNERNSYLHEEVEVILCLLHRDWVCRNGSVIISDPDRVDDLKQAIIRKVENEAYVRCGRFDCLENNKMYRELKKADKQMIERAMKDIVYEMVKKIIARLEETNKITRGSFRYNGTLSARNNLICALDLWIRNK